MKTPIFFSLAAECFDEFRDTCEWFETALDRWDVTDCFYAFGVLELSLAPREFFYDMKAGRVGDDSAGGLRCPRLIARKEEA